MSFMSPKTELPGSMSDNTPGRNNTYRQAEVVPLAYGRFRVGVKWITPVLNWKFVNTKTSSNAFFSCIGVLCQGPVDEVVGLHVNGKPYHGIFAFRDVAPFDYASLTIANNVTEYYRVWYGSETQGTDAWLQNLVTDPAHPMYNKVHPGYKGICYIGIKDMFAGSSTGGSTPALPNVEVELQRISPTAFSFGYAGHGTHPLGVVRDVYQDKRGGLGLPDSFFDNTDWTAKMNRLQTSGIAGRVGTDLWISPLLTQAKPAHEVVADLLSYVDGWIRWRNGKVEIDWYPNDGSSPGTIRELSFHDMVEEPQIDAQGLDKIVSKVAVTALDVAATDTALSEIVEVAQVPYALQLTGEPNVEQIQRPFYVTRDQARSYAAMMAATRALPDLSGEITVRRESATQPDNITPLLPGDRFNLDYTPFTLDVLCRIVERTDSEDKADVTIKFTKERGASPTPYVPPLDTRVIITQPGASAITDFLPIQIPYDTSPREIAILAVRSVNTLAGFQIHYSPNNTWPGTIIGPRFPFWCVSGVLKTALPATLTDTTANVDATGIDFGDLMQSQTLVEQDDDELLMIANGEWLSIGAITPVSGITYTLALSRGRQKTPFITHAVNDVVYFVRRAELCTVAHPDFDISGTTRYFKVQGYNQIGDSATISAAASLAMTTHAPGVPANLHIVVGTGKMIKIEWDPAANADEYDVYRATGPGYTDEALIGEVSDTRFYDVTTTPGVTYRYRVKTFSPDEEFSAFSGSVTGVAGNVNSPSGPPSDPTAATITGQGFYTAQEGSVLAYIEMSVPALPTGALTQNILLCTDTAHPERGVIAQQLFNTSTETIRIDDLSPGINYTLGTQAWNDFPSNVITANGCPFTAPAKSAPPGVPTGAGVLGSTSPVAIPPQLDYLGGGTMYGSYFYWTAPADRDIDFYEICLNVGTDLGGGTPQSIVRDTFTFVYQVNLLFDIFCYVRSVNRSGVRSAYVGGGNARGASVQVAGTIATQNENNASVTGVKVGGTASVKQTVQVPVAMGVSLTGGTLQETVFISIPAGFTYPPDAAQLECNSDSDIKVNYANSPTFVGNTASGVYVTFVLVNTSFRTVLPNSTVYISGWFSGYI